MKESNEMLRCEEDGEESVLEERPLVGMPIRTKDGRPGKIVVHDPSDHLLELKVEFSDVALFRLGYFNFAKLNTESMVK